MDNILSKPSKTEEKQDEEDMDMDTEDESTLNTEQQSKEYNVNGEIFPEFELSSNSEYASLAKQFSTIKLSPQ